MTPIQPSLNTIKRWGLAEMWRLSGSPRCLTSTTTESRKRK